MTNLLIKTALEIAMMEDVSTPKNGAVVYSISFLATTENRDMAYAFEIKHAGALTLDHTVCGKKLTALGLLVSKDVATSDIQKVWEIASERFIKAASGNVTAFVNGADKRSTFCSLEAQNILKNDKIKTVNNIAKEDFLRPFI